MTLDCEKIKLFTVRSLANTIRLTNEPVQQSLGNAET